MHIQAQRLQRPDGNRILFGIKFVLETTPAERALIEKYQAVDVAHLSVEHVSMLQGMMAGGLQEWREDIRRIVDIEQSWLAAGNALVGYLSDATGHYTEDAEGETYRLGYLSSGEFFSGAGDGE